MARGRVITPDFWTDEKMIGLSPLARLFYLGLWNFAYCDKGHLPDEPLGLKLKILPNDPVAPADLMGELIGAGRLVRIKSADGKTFLWMPSFEKHQKTDSRWKTRCPACALINSGKLTETQESLSEHTETLLSSALREEKRTRENQREENQNTLTRVERLFDDAYSHWPKKVERKAAFEKFKSVNRRADGTEALAAHITRFGDAYAATTEKRFVPALSVWLSHERWTDELPTAQVSMSTTSEQNLSVVQMYAARENQQGAINE